MLTPGYMHSEYVCTQSSLDSCDHAASALKKSIYKAVSDNGTDLFVSWKAVHEGDKRIWEATYAIGLQHVCICMQQPLRDNTFKLWG